MTPQKTLQANRLKYGTPMTSEENASLLNETAYAHRAENWGVYAKPSGSNCQRSDGAFISRDILCQLGSATGVDCLRDAEGIAEPVWSEGVAIDPSNWLGPIPPATAPPGPIPDPVTTYGQWVNVEIHILVSAYVAKHDNDPAASDFAHLAYRRLVERWTIAAMVADI